MLFGYPILNHFSAGLNEYFNRAIHALDEAGGEAIDIICIGNPAQSGRIHKSLRTEQQRLRDEQQAREYVERIYQSGNEQHHLLGEMIGFVSKLKLSPTDIPCIAFLTRTGTRPVGVFRISPFWYESTASLKAFDACLREWLARDDVKRVAIAADCLGETDVSKGLGPLLNALIAEIDDKIGSDGAGSRVPDASAAMATSAAKHGTVHFDTPTGATWREVEIRFKNGHDVSVKVLGAHGVFNYTQMEMTDRRTGNPDSQWHLLHSFAQEEGILEWSSRKADRKHKHGKKRLAEVLRKFFRIDGDPFELTPDRKGWKARFRILPEG